MFQNGNQIFEETVAENAILDLRNSGRSVYDIGKGLTPSRTEETAHAYLSDLVIFNLELPKHELEEWVRSHALYNFM